MLIRFLVLCTFFTLANGVRAQWLPKNSSLDYERIRSVRFVSSTTGFAVGDTNSIFKTTTGGEHWEKLDVLDCSGCIINYRSVWFFGSLRGYIWGHDVLRGARIVLATTNGGVSWHISDSTVASVNYRSEDFGYTVGISNYTSQVLITTDLGRTWQQRWATTHLPFYDLADIHGMFGDSLNAVIEDFRNAGHAGQSHESHHYKKYTTDGGKTWHNSIMQPRLFSALGGHRWLGLRQDTVVRSDDGGHTWPGVSVPGYPISYYLPLTYTIVYATLGHATDVARSNDAGVTWSREFVADSLTSVVGMQRFVEGGQEILYMAARGTTWRGVKVFKQIGTVLTVKQTSSERTGLKVEFSPDAVEVTGAGHDVYLMDVLGRVVATGKPVSGKWSLNTSGLPRGIYFISSGTAYLKLNVAR